MDLEEKEYRNLVVGTDTKVPIENEVMSEYINFDNAATTPPFVSVMKKINEFVPLYSSIHRGNGYKSIYSSKLYEESKINVAKFVGADLKKDTVIYLKNTTEAINKLAYRFYKKNKKCVILSSYMEHHSNDLPWREKYIVKYIAVDENGRLDLHDLKRKLIKYWGLVKLVCVSGASNVTGYINPIYKIAKLVHQYNAKILVDGAQLIPHVAVDMQPHGSKDHIDYLVFSAHKMYAPFGIGVLIGHKNTFEYGSPEYKGGGTVDIVTHECIIWNEPPEREEAGTPNVIGAVALAQAIDTLTDIGMENVQQYEERLACYAMKQLREIPQVTIYEDSECRDRLGIICFNVEYIHHSEVARLLSQKGGIGVRSGCFCAQPYVQKLLKLTHKDVLKYMGKEKKDRPGMVRISFGIYNNFEEIDCFMRVLKDIIHDNI